MSDPLDLLTESEAAAILHKSERSVRLLRRRGRLRYLPGRPVLIQRRALADYVEQAMVTRRVLRPARRWSPTSRTKI